MSTRRMREFFQRIGSIPDLMEETGRIEVCLIDTCHGGSPVIYLTKYRGRALGQRGVGIHPAVANAIASMLRDAVSKVQERHLPKEES